MWEYGTGGSRNTEGRGDPIYGFEALPEFGQLQDKLGVKAIRPPDSRLPGASGGRANRFFAVQERRREVDSSFYHLWTPAVDWSEARPLAREKRTRRKMRRGCRCWSCKTVDRTSPLFARSAPQKGLDGYAVGALKQVVEQFGRKKVLMKSDNEPAICLQDLVRKETDIEIAMEEAHVGDHQASGVAKGSSGP